jgi:hypothetical protein
MRAGSQDRTPSRNQVYTDLSRSPRPPDSPTRLVKYGCGFVAAVALLFALVIDAATMTRIPEPFGDEAWVGSAVWSLTHGHGLRPAIAAGIGVYDHVGDYWMPRIGIVPQIAAQLIAGTSFTAYRAATLATMFVGFGVLLRSLGRRYGFARAAVAVSSIATTWIVFESSHYIRWDAVTFAWSSVVLALLVDGPPSSRKAAALGLLLGVVPDFSVPTTALVPAVAVFVGWVAAGRRRRLLLFAAGTLSGFLIYCALHFLPDPGVARQQWKLIYAGAYRVPLLAAITDHSLHPILAERQRYTAMALSPLYEARLLLGCAVFCALGALAVRARRGPYPWRIAGSVLLLTQLIGLAFLYANHAPLYLTGAMPFAAAALIEGLSLMPGRTTATLATVALLAAFTAAGGRTIASAASSDPAGAAANAALSRVALRLRPTSGVAMGDYVYWWLFRDARFRFNAAIWFRRYNDGDSFDKAFEAVCPSLVVLDDFWLARYAYWGPDALGRRFPDLAPTDHNEERKLMRLLFKDYRYPPTLEVAGGRAVEFWQRKRPCPPVSAGQ